MLSSKADRLRKKNVRFPMKTGITQCESIESPNTKAALVNAAHEARVQTELLADQVLNR